MQIKEIMINVAMLNKITITYGNKYLIIQLLISNRLRLNIRLIDALICIIHNQKNNARSCSSTQILEKKCEFPLIKHCEKKWSECGIYMCILGMGDLYISIPFVLIQSL